MSEIQALTLKVRELSENVDLWNVLMLWGLGVAAAAAVFIVISTRIIVTRSGQLSEAQSSLTAAKDRQLQVDLKAKDVEIDGLKAKSQGYESEISGAKRDAATATSKAAKANESAEKEHLERLKLEAQLAPRRLDGDEITNLGRVFAPLKGKLVRVASYSLDIESEIVATQLKGSLELAGATVLNDIGAEVPSGDIMVGVWVVGSDPVLKQLVGTSLADATHLRDIVELPAATIPHGPMHYDRIVQPTGEPVVTIFVGRKSLAGN